MEQWLYTNVFLIIIVLLPEVSEKPAFISGLLPQKVDLVQMRCKDEDECTV